MTVWCSKQGCFFCSSIAISHNIVENLLALFLNLHKTEDTFAGSGSLHGFLAVDKYIIYHNTGTPVTASKCSSMTSNYTVVFSHWPNNVVFDVFCHSPNTYYVYVINKNKWMGCLQSLMARPCSMSTTRAKNSQPQSLVSWAESRVSVGQTLADPGWDDRDWTDRLPAMEG